MSTDTAVIISSTETRQKEKAEDTENRKQSQIGKVVDIMGLVLA